MPRATAHRSARRWGSRFDVISGSQLTDSSSLASDDAITSITTGTNTKRTNGNASSESGFGDESSSAASHLTATTATAANRSALSDPYSVSEGGGFAWADEPHDASASWGADSLLSPRPPTSVNPNVSETSKTFPTTYPSPHHPPFSTDLKGASLPPRRSQRWNHNASVFVASLPPEPNAELDKYLRESLGKHGNILNIKFIHDVRSGNASNCAFVQFEHPQEAVNAIQACHMTFIQGRAIRCEPAKAHRTLLISFSPPPASTPSETSSKNMDSRTGIDPTDKSPEWVRIRRPDPRTHFIYVTFNKVALEYADNQPPHWTDESDPLSGPGALVSLTHEVPKAETMRILVELFGPLEIFRPFMVPLPEEVHGHPYAPHPFSAEGDDASTYEVKWEQRQDAISALYCLNRIPNLIVTWAHEHPHPANYRDSFRYGAYVMSPNRRSPRHEPTDIQPNQMPMTPSKHAIHRQPARTPVAGMEPGDHERTPINTVKNIASPIPYNKVAAMASLKSTINRRPSELVSPGHVKPTPAKEDFPRLPCATMTGRAGPDANAVAVEDTLSSSSRQDRPTDTSASAPSVEADASDMSEASMDGGDGAINVSTEVAPPLSRRESVTPPPTTAPPSDQPEGKPAYPSTAGMDTPDSVPLSPETPSLICHSPSRSPASVDITPSSSVMPITPSPLLRSSRPLTQQSIEFASYKERAMAGKVATARPQNINSSVDGAPVTDSLFVGGLDLSYGWTEDKIEETFGVYGEIIGVKMIFKNLDPVGRCFIKFANPSDIAKAIAGENGRAYGGRSLRVSYSNNAYSRARIGHTGRRHGSGVPTRGLGLQGMASHKLRDSHVEVGDVFLSTHGTSATAGIENDDRLTHAPVIAPVGNEEPPSPSSGPKSPSATPSRTAIVLAASDSAPAALDLMSSHRAMDAKSSSRQSPALIPDSKIARNETDSPSTPQKSSILPNSGSVRSIHLQTPASSSTISVQRRRSHVRAHSDPATPSSADHPPANVDRLLSQMTESQPIYPHPQDMYFPYSPMFYVHPVPAQPPAGAAAFPEFGIGNNPHRHQWRPAWYPPLPANPAYLSMPTNTTSGLAGPSGPQPPLQPTGFVHNENGALLPVYGNDALEQYMNTSRGTPTGEIANPGVPGHANSTWSSVPPFPAFPPWLPQQLMVPVPPQHPPAPVLPPLTVPSNGGDWNVSSPPTPHSQSHPQPFSPSAVQLSQFPHQAQSPFAPTPFPMHPVGVNQQTSGTSAPMSAHIRSRPYGGKRMTSHGEGAQMGAQVGKPSKHSNEPRSRQQQQQYADEGPAHHHQQYARQANVGGHSGPGGQPAPIFPYAAYSYPFDPNANPGSVGHHFPIQHSHIPPKATMQVPAQWNIVPAAYDNP